MQIRGMWSAGPGDDQARFLADLRALRDMAAIGHDELAARAHYPSNVLKEAENGPLLPGLPVLTAYVRACEGDVLDWEERWRSLARVVPEDPGLPVRPPGASPAAAAGARAGVGVAPPDVYDPDRIRAALRGGHEPSDQSSRRNGDPGIAAPSQGFEFADRAPAEWDTAFNEDAGSWQDAGANPDTDLGTGMSGNASSGWDAVAAPAAPMTNGNHSLKHESRGTFDSAIVDVPDSAERAGQPDEFRWLPENEAASRSAGDEFSWPGDEDATRTDVRPADAGPWRADAGLADTGLADTGLADTGLADTGLADTGRTDARPAKAPADIDALAAGQIVTRWTPLNQEDLLTQPERDDFWATSAPPAAADLQLPAASARQVENQKPEHDFPAPAQAVGASAASVSQRRAAESAPSARDVTSTPRAPAEPTRHGKDRFFPARLMVIIIIAALIGSALVLILR